MLKTGIGYSNLNDSYFSGVAVAQKALKHGRINNPDLVFAFCNSAVDHDDFYRGLRSVLGDSPPIIGGSGIGIITNNELSYEGYPAGVLIIESDDMKFSVASAHGLSQSIRDTGVAMAKQFTRSSDDVLFLLWYDSIRQPASLQSPPVINSSTPLINAVTQILGNDVPIVGGGLLGDNSFGRTKQFSGKGVEEQSAIGCLISGNYKSFTRIMHGCTPLDGTYHTITRIEGNILYELDGRPVVEILDDIYGHTDWRHEQPLKLISIGVNFGDRYSYPVEANYVNRLITGALPDSSGIMLFETDISEGTEIQFMLRDTSEMIESTYTNSAELLKQVEIEGFSPILGIYIDCGGRCSAISNTYIEEASEVQKVFNNADIPLFGFYSGVEIAPLLQHSRGLDYTGVLTVLAQ